METIFEFDRGNIKYKKSNDLLKVRWREGISEEEYWNLMQELFMFTIEYKVAAWLIDARDSDLTEAESMEIRLEQIRETLRKTCLRKIARLVSDNIAFEAKLQRIHLEGKKEIAFQFFTEKNAAMGWLKS